MDKPKEIVVVGAEVKISPEAIHACHRLLAEDDPYPGLEFSGNMESYNRMRDDVELIAQTLFKMLREVALQIQKNETPRAN
jgi:hypothetical protein